MNRKKVVSAYTGIRDYPAGIKPAGRVQRIRKVWSSAVPVIRSLVQSTLALDDEAVKTFPEIKDREYLLPAAYTAALLTAMNNPEWFGSLVARLAAINREEPEFVVDVIGRHFPYMAMARYYRIHNVIKYAVSSENLNSASGIGDPLDIPIDDLMGMVKEPLVFYVDNGDAYHVFNTPYYVQETGKFKTVMRIELLGGSQGSTFFDIHRKLEEHVTLRDLYEYYKSQHLELVPEEQTGIAMDETVRILPVLMLTVSDNIVLPAPSEFNEERDRLIREGRGGRAKRHESFKFIDLDEIRFTPRKSSGGESTGQVKSAHMRSGHFRRQRYGARDAWQYKIIWIAPVAVHGGNADENRVFYVIK